MSLDASRWAWQQKITATQKLVLLSLADRANEINQCFPSTTRLVNDTGLYRETIFEAIKQLEKLGLLSVKRELGKGNYFTLIGVQDRHQTSSDLQTTKQNATSSEKPTPTSREKPTTQSVNADTYQSVNADTESTIESIINLPVESTSKKLPKINFLDNGFEEFWNAYPKKKNRADAEKAWKKLKPKIDDILKAMQWQKQSNDWQKSNGQFIPYPATYLNANSWLDEPETEGVPF